MSTSARTLLGADDAPNASQLEGGMTLEEFNAKKKAAAPTQNNERTEGRQVDASAFAGMKVLNGGQQQTKKKGGHKANSQSHQNKKGDAIKLQDLAEREEEDWVVLPSEKVAAEEAIPEQPQGWGSWLINMGGKPEPAAPAAPAK